MSGMMPGHGQRARAGFRRHRAGHRSDQNPAGLRLPPGIHNRAAAFADDAVIPFPRRRIDRLAHRAQQAQARKIVRVRPMIALANQRADGRGRRVENIDAILLHQAPPAVELRVIQRPFVHHRRRARRERTVNDVAVPGHPPNIGRAPIGVFVPQIEDPFHGGRHVRQVAAGGMQNPLWLPGSAGCVEHKQRMLTVERHGGAVLRFGPRQCRVQIVPPGIAARLHYQLGTGAPVNDHVAHSRALGQRFIHRGLQLHFLAATVAAVGRNHHSRAQVLNARLQRLRREPAEHHAMYDPQPRARQHGDGQLRDHRHIDDGAVARFISARLQHVREARHQSQQFLIADRALLARLALPQDRDLVLAVRSGMPVQTIVGDVGFRPHEPLRERRLPVQYLLPGFEPVNLAARDIAPEGFRILLRSPV